MASATLVQTRQRLIKGSFLALAARGARLPDSQTPRHPHGACSWQGPTGLHLVEGGLPSRHKHLGTRQGNQPWPLGSVRASPSGIVALSPPSLRSLPQKTSSPYAASSFISARSPFCVLAQSCSSSPRFLTLDTHFTFITSQLQTSHLGLCIVIALIGALPFLIACFRLLLGFCGRSLLPAHQLPPLADQPSSP